MTPQSTTAPVEPVPVEPIPVDPVPGTTASGGSVRAAHRDALSQWHVTLDPGAAWEADRLYPPGRPPADLPSQPPSMGWDALDDGQLLQIPATTDQLSPDYHGVSWWSTTVVLGPPDPGSGSADATGSTDVPGTGSATESPDIRLLFHGSRLRTEVYWDKQLIGYELECYTPFEIAVPAALAGPGRHRLDVRITNPGGSGNWGDSEVLWWGRWPLPSSHDFGGLWQPVELQRSYGARIADVYARPLPDLAGFDVDVETELRPTDRVSTDGRLELTLLDADGTVVATAEQTLAAGTDGRTGPTRFRLPVPDPRPYGPATPHRYLLRTKLSTPVTEDVHECRPGLRLLDAVGDRLEFNGEPFYLRTSISWGKYLHGPHPSAAELTAEADAAAALGNNTLSAHRRAATTALIDQLEQRGLLMYAEPGGMPSVVDVDWDALDAEQAALLREWALQRLTRLVRRDRSRAAVVWWDIANEAMDPDIERIRYPVRDLLTAVRELDDSRITTWTSAWQITPMYRPFRPEQLRLFDFHSVGNWPALWNPRIEREIAAIAAPEQVVAIVGESTTLCGLGALVDLPDPDPTSTALSEMWQWRAQLDADIAALDATAALGNAEQIATRTAEIHGESVARLVECTRAEPAMSGLAINGWHFHPMIGSSGIVGVDRRPAFDPARVAAANAAEALVVSGVQPLAAVGDTQTIRVRLVSDALAALGDRTSGSTDPGGGDDTAVDGTLTVRLCAGETVLAEQELAVRTRSRAGDRVVELTRPTVTIPQPGPLTLHATVRCRVGARELQLSGTHDLFGVPAVSELAGVAVHDPTGMLDALSVKASGLAWTFGDTRPSLVVQSNMSVLLPLLGDTTGGPRTVVMLDPADMVDGAGGPLALALRRVRLLADDGLVSPVAGCWIGGWGFTLDSGVLPSLGPEGMWSLPHTMAMPSSTLVGVRGRALSGAVSFPDGDIGTIGTPRIGAGHVVVRGLGGREVLIAMPTPQAPPALQRALLADYARWARAETGTT